MRLPSLQTRTAAPGFPGHPHFWTTGYKFEGSHYPLRFDNSLEWLTELKKELYLWSQSYYSKRIQIKTRQKTERHIGWALGGSQMGSFCVLSPGSQEESDSWHINVYYQPGGLSKLWVQSFIGIILPEHDCFNSWPCDWSQSPAPDLRPPPRGGWIGITWLRALTL